MCTQILCVHAVDNMSENYTNLLQNLCFFLRSRKLAPSNYSAIQGRHEDKPSSGRRSAARPNQCKSHRAEYHAHRPSIHSSTQTRAKSRLRRALNGALVAPSLGIECFETQRVQLDCQYGTRSHKPSMEYSVWGPNSI